MAGELPFVNGVRSNLIEEQIREQALPPSADAIIIFGTATQGPLLTPTRVTAASIETVFGPSINDPYEKFNLVKGFHEINGSLPRADIIAVRVGDAKKATLNLYEQQVTSGVLTPQSTDTVSITLEALEDGLAGNAVTADVYGDEQGVPTRMIVGLPNGSTIEYDLANTYKTPSSLAAAMNADDEISQYVKTTSNVLSNTSGTVTITESSVVSGQIETTYSLPHNYILDLTSVYTADEIEDATSIAAGRGSATLASTPTKDESELTNTINKFWTIKTSEELTDGAITPSDVGETVFTLDAAADPKYDNTDATNSIKYLVVKKKSGTTGVISTLTLTTDYSYNFGTAKITLTSGAALGDRYYASYYYLTSFAEANVRSALDTGNPYSYFVGGDTITFGANQTWPLAVAYDTKTNFIIPGDVTISDATAGTLKFSVNENSPAIGDTLNVEYLYEPELPAPNSPTGTEMPSGRRQASQLSGGASGRKVTLPQYYNELAKGYLAADNTPFRIAVPQGVYLDDTMLGIDFETGLELEQNAGFHTQLGVFLARHSVFVSECIGIMSVKPMAASNPAFPTLAEREAWYEKLVNVSATDTTRAANVMASINDFHLVVTAGDFLLSHTNVANGKIYVEGAHNIFAGMKFFHDNLTSIITRSVPKTMIRGMQYKIVSSDRINAVSQARYTLITEDSDTGNFKAAQAPTLASSTSQFRKQYNLDITIEAVNRVRRVLKPFIGQPNKNSVREAMRQAAKQELQLMSPDKLMAFELEVVTTRGEAINGRVQVDLTLTTAVEIGLINIRTRLQLGF